MFFSALAAARREASDWNARAAAFQAIYPSTPNVFARIAELSQEKVVILEKYLEALQKIELIMRQPQARPLEK